MSRLIIKGLPSRYDDKSLRELFAFAGEVTDAKVIKTREGRSRQFGFVGFRTSQDAKSARHRLNKSYVDTQKVSVDFAHAVGAETIPRPWSKYSEGSSLHDKNKKDKDVDLRKEFLRKEAQRNRRMRELKKKEVGDGLTDKDKAALKEFQETAGKRGSNPVWADGNVRSTERSTLVASRKTGGEGKFLERKHVTFDVDESDDEEDALYQDLPDSSGLTTAVLDATEEIPEEGDNVALNEGVSDMDYFRSKVVKKDTASQGSNENEDSVRPEAENENFANNSDENGDGSYPSTSSKASDSDEEDIGSTGEGKKSGDPATVDIEETTCAKEVNITKSEGRGAAEVVDASETGRLLVRNLAYSVTDEELETVFEPFGTLADVHVVRDGQTGKSRGIAFVQYVVPENAPQALLAVDGTFQSGRILHILPARPRPTAHVGNAHGTGSSTKPGNSKFKAEKEETQKEAARTGRDSAAQHAMHMSSDAVAEIMADRHGVSKADLFGTARGESGIAAVRLAMAEATLQGETRQFLLENGVDLSVVEKTSLEVNATTAAAKRKRQSRAAFLVKNLPARSTEKQLEGVFGRFGTLNRLVVVPSGTLAVVEYNISSNAKQAFNSLAYTKFRDAPLYLDWLPTEALKAIKERNTEESPSPQSNTEGQQRSSSQTMEDPVKTTENFESKSRSVYVKNLNFDTRDAELKAHFMKMLRKRSKIAASLRSATVAMKRKNEGKTSERLSMGFGFLEFSSRADAVEAVKIAQNTVLDGHTLQLRLSNQGDDDQQRNLKRKKAPTKVKKACPKLIVRNVAFEATKRDIRQLFSSFGQLKTVRVPRKMDGSHRGFAFVEFVSKGEAKAAFEALTSAHLYGRHLVIEYAEDAGTGFGSISELQEKAEEQMIRKRIRTSDGASAPSAPSEEPNDANVDEQAMLEDELYG